MGSAPARLTETATPGSSEDREQAPFPEGPHFDYPTVEAEILQSSILTDFGGFDSPMRQVTVLDAAGQKMEVISTFHRNLPKESASDMAWKITEFADLNAAFTETHRIDAGTTADGASVRLHVGDFAQDLCGPLTTVYTVESKEVTSYVDAADLNHALFDGSGCTIDTPTGGETCDDRARCMRKHLQELPLDGLLDTPKLRRLMTLRIH